MIQLPEINKRNWKKILRELDISQFPSLPPKLEELRIAFKNKQDVPIQDELLGYARMTTYFEKYTAQINSLYVMTMDWSKFSHRPPKEHQKAGVEFLLKNNKCILGDTMGTGKSITTIYATLMMEPKHRVLIVTLKSLKYNFYKEVKYFTDDVVVVDKKWETAKFTIINYDALNKFKKEMALESFSIMILDEAHKVRNPKAKRTEIMMDYIKAKNPLKLWLLTGTPVDNRPYDYYNLLKMIKHPVAKNWVHFITQYCDGKQDMWGRWITDGHSNLEELHRLTQDIFLRRTIKDTGLDLPEFSRRPIFYELKNKKGYKQCITDYEDRKLNELMDEFGSDIRYDGYEAEVMTKLLLHRQFCALEKVEDGTLSELIDNLLEESEDNKIIVFTNFTKVVDVVADLYGEICTWIDGRILDPKKRLELVDNFNADPKLKILVCNLKVGSTGLNIQSANKVIFNDMDWVPSNMLQAEARAWRIGQTREVEALYPVYDDTVEVSLFSTVEEKMRVISTVIEGTEENYFDGENAAGKKKEVAQNDRKSLIEAILAQLK